MKKLITTVALALSALCTIAQVPTNGLVAYYPFDGNANDASGNGNNGTVNGATLTTDKNNIANSAYSFNNSNIKLPNNLIGDYTKSSISLWFKTTTSGVIFGQNNNIHPNTASDHVPIMYIDTQGALACKFFTGDIIPILYPNANNGKFHHAVLVSDVTTQSLYVDGAIVGTITKNIIIATGMIHQYLGTGATGNWPNTNSNWFNFNGTIDNVRVYNRSLTQSEIASLYQEGCTSTSTTTQSACTSYTWNGTTYTTSGTYTKTGLKNKVGCDSTATLNLTILKASTSTTTQSACVSYTWNGTTYTTSGTYTKTGLKNKVGCDSTATLNLTILKASTSTTTQSACVSYTWNGTTYTTSGTYTKTGLKNKAGCDSTATLNLTITPVLAVSFTGLPATLSTQSNKITLVGTPTGGTFAGLGVSGTQLDPKVGKLGNRTISYSVSVNNCNNSAKQTTMVFDTVGNYCSVRDTLFIKTLITGSNAVVLENTIKIYPNPASDFLIIENGNFGIMTGYSVQVVNAQGQTVFSSAINQAQFNINLSNWAKNSLYVVKLFNAQNAVVETKKVILQ